MKPCCISSLLTVGGRPDGGPRPRPIPRPVPAGGPRPVPAGGPPDGGRPHPIPRPGRAPAGPRPHPFVRGGRGRGRARGRPPHRGGRGHGRARAGPARHPHPERARGAGRGHVPRPAEAPGVRRVRAARPHPLARMRTRGAGRSHVPRPAHAPDGPAHPPARHAGRDSPEDMSIDTSLQGIIRGLHQTVDEFTTAMRDTHSAMSSSTTSTTTTAATGRHVRFAEEESKQAQPLRSGWVAEETKQNASEEGNSFLDRPSVLYEVVDDTGTHRFDTHYDRYDAAMDMCMVCFQDFEDDAHQKYLPCLHGFHSRCIEQHIRLTLHRPLCPHCQTPVQLPFYCDDGTVLAAESTTAAADAAAAAAESTTAAADAAAAAAAATTTSEPDLCLVCHDELSGLASILPCSHKFHQACITRWLQTELDTAWFRSSVGPRCPVCRETASVSEATSFSYTVTNPEPASTGGVPTVEAPAVEAVETVESVESVESVEPEPAGPAPTGGVPTDEALAPHPEPEPAPTGAAPTGGVPTNEAPEPAGAPTDPEPAARAPAPRRSSRGSAPTGDGPGAPTDEAPVPAPPPIGDAHESLTVKRSRLKPAPSQTAAAENAGAPAGVTTGPPAPSDETVASVASNVSGSPPKRRRSKYNQIRSPTAAAENVGAPQTSPAAVVLVAAAENVGAPAAGAPAPGGETIVSDAPTSAQRSATSGSLFGWGWFHQRFPGEEAPRQVDQGVPPVSAPLNIRAHFVEDDSPIGEVSFDEAADDELSGMSMNLN